MKSAIVLLSGGLDSTVSLACAVDRDYDYIQTVSYDYNQRHKSELIAASAVAAHYNLPHTIYPIALPALPSSLTQSDILPHENRAPENMSLFLPNTWVPGRNAVFLTHACQVSYSLFKTTDAIYALDIYIGVNILDYSGYPDCRPKFIVRFAEMINAAFEGSVRFNIKTPLISLTKTQIIQKGIDLNAPLGLTISCYHGTRCGTCDSCILRTAGFQTIGIPDPANFK